MSGSSGSTFPSSAYISYIFPEVSLETYLIFFNILISLPISSFLNSLSVILLFTTFRSALFFCIHYKRKNQKKLKLKSILIEL